MQCKGRYCRERQEIRFPLRSGYFTELRCTNLAAGSGSEPELCCDCLEKSKKPFTPKYQQSQYQGKIDEPYYKMSWIFGSDRFIEYNQLPGNALSPEEYARAEAAQKIARQGSEMKQKAEQVAKAGSPEAAKPKVTLVKPGRPRKVQNAVVIPKPATAPCKPIGVVLIDEPLEASEVIKVMIQKCVVKEQHYWKDEEGAIYTCGSGDSIGKKIGNEENIE